MYADKYYINFMKKLIIGYSTYFRVSSIDTGALPLQSPSPTIAVKIINQTIAVLFTCFTSIYEQISTLQWKFEF